MRKPVHDPERASVMRIAGGIILALSGWIVLASLALQYGDTVAAVSNGVVGALLALLALTILRNPFGSVPTCYLTAIGGLWLFVAPFVLGYARYTLSMGNNLWVGVIITVLSAFIVGEALQLEQSVSVQHSTSGDAATRMQPKD